VTVTVTVTTTHLRLGHLLFCEPLRGLRLGSCNIPIRTNLCMCVFA
jgi:hypothetical protein